MITLGVSCFNTPRRRPGLSSSAENCILLLRTWIVVSMQSQYDSPDQSLIELRVAPFCRLDFGQGWVFRVIVSDILLGLSLSSHRL
jgi:hypothetical protein